MWNPGSTNSIRSHYLEFPANLIERRKQKTSVHCNPSGILDFYWNQSTSDVSVLLSNFTSDCHLLWRMFRSITYLVQKPRKVWDNRLHHITGSQIAGPSIGTLVMTKWRNLSMWQFQEKSMCHSEVRILLHSYLLPCIPGFGGTHHPMPCSYSKPEWSHAKIQSVHNALDVFLKGIR